MMDKKTLRKIPREAPTEKIKAAARLLREGSLVATAHYIGDEDSETMQLYFYRNVKGEATEDIRVFVNKVDYITQDLKKDKTHWLTGKIFYVLRWWVWSSPREIIRFVDEESRKTFDSFIPDDGKGNKEYAGKEDDWVYRLWRWQENVAERRLHEKHRKVLEKSEALAKLGDLPLPDDFDEWIRETVHHDNYYLQYEPSRKREITGYCSHCRKMVTIDRKKEHIRMFHKGTCPSCGMPVTFVTKRNALEAGREAAVIVQKITGGVVFRYFFTWMETKKVRYFLKTEVGRTEISRVFNFDDGRREIVDWGRYKNESYETWCPQGTATETWNYVSGEHVYTKGLQDTLAGTKWKYSGITEYQEKAGYRPIQFSSFMYHYPENPYLEFLAKAGFVKLLNDTCDRYGFVGRERFDKNAKSPVQLFGLPKAYIRILRMTDGGESMLDNLKQCMRDHAIPADEEIKQYTDIFGSAERMLEVINAHTNIGKFLKYLEKQLKSHKGLRISLPSCWEWPERGHMGEWRRKESIKLLARDWQDYIRWAADLGYDLNDKYYLLPPDIEKAHDKMLAEYQKKRDEIEKKKKEAEERLFNEMMKQAESEGKENEIFGMHSKKYMVVLPKTADDLKREGSHNHNCVGTYVGRVAEGKTMILFIRRVESPDEPFYTMEYHDGKTIQCRGMRNVPAEGEVYAFSKAVERRLRMIEQEAVKNIGKDEAKRCRIAISWQG